MSYESHITNYIDHLVRSRSGGQVYIRIFTLTVLLEYIDLWLVTVLLEYLFDCSIRVYRSDTVTVV